MSGNAEKQVGDILVVQPALEPWPSGLLRIGPFALFFYARWSTIGLAIEILSAGAALVIGPFMIGACHIRRQLTASDALLTARQKDTP